MIRITHHRAKCIGCGYCIEVAPYRWLMNKKDGKTDLISAKGKKEIYTLVVADDEFENNKEAAELCPVKIIRVEKV
ncbi:MAG: ferredoxin [Bacteroidales bacterium]|nr:ferredoxin [Bacteroidales bacterium]MBN2757341.1 ferredoxin [Bacteroidales bacterium]